MAIFESNIPLKEKMTFKTKYDFKCPHCWKKKYRILEMATHSQYLNNSITFYMLLCKCDNCLRMWEPEELSRENFLRARLTFLDSNITSFADLWNFKET